jgi:DedD protein
MAFFKFRKKGDEPSATPAQTESVEGMRKRAKYRLIGAAVLVLIGVIGFPMLFDKQPRPISVDTPIEIPDKNKVKPLSIPAPAATQAVKPESSAPVLPAAPVVEAVAPKSDVKVPIAPVQHAQEAIKNIANSESKAVEKPAEKPAPVAKPVVKADEGAKVQALLDGKTVEKKPDAAESRFIVQVGAFADATRAHEVRQKVEHAGLKTYTHVAQTKEGSRIRVRVGPFGTRAEAEKAAEKIKKLALPAAILTL